MKQEAILKAAKKLFSKFGFKKVSMDEIAREAGSRTKVAVYSEDKNLDVKDVTVG